MSHHPDPRFSSLGAARTVSLSAGEIEYHERGTGRPIVFLHGIALHAGLWRAVVPPLADRFRCITPTLPLGSHRHPMRPDADLTPTGLAELVAEFLAALELDDVVLVGNDTGGALAQILVTRWPERVGALVLTSCDAFDNFLPWQVRHLQLLARIPGAAWVIAQNLRSAFFRRSLFGYGLGTRHGIADDVTASYAEPLITLPGTRRDVVRVLKGIRSRYTAEAARQLHRFERPVLMAWAREDRLFPAAHAERLAALFPDARVEWIDDSLTYIPEDQPARLAAAIERFLAAAERAATASAAAEGVM
ncbi:MAG TPA: alpha/beta hydrolase [Longimicrobium sp.]|nr:alpha/beta hydrolase [Longimicrobium sp.]